MTLVYPPAILSNHSAVLCWSTVGFAASDQLQYFTFAAIQFHSNPADAASRQDSCASASWVGWQLRQFTHLPTDKYPNEVGYLIGLEMVAHFSVYGYRNENSSLFIGQICAGMGELYRACLPTNRTNSFRVLYFCWKLSLFVCDELYQFVSPF